MAANRGAAGGTAGEGEVWGSVLGSCWFEEIEMKEMKTCGGGRA